MGPSLAALHGRSKSNRIEASLLTVELPVPVLVPLAIAPARARARARVLVGPLACA